MMKEGRSLAETPTYSVASVVTVLVFVCFLVERAIYRFGKWLKKTRRKALFTSLEKMKEVDVAGTYITSVVTKREMDFRNLC